MPFIKLIIFFAILFGFANSLGWGDAIFYLILAPILYLILK